VNKLSSEDAFEELFFRENGELLLNGQLPENLLSRIPASLMLYANGIQAVRFSAFEGIAKPGLN
jgi:hypothetical protein